MSYRRLLLVTIIVAALAGVAFGVSAQADDRDGDGLPDRVDRCPDEAGPRENGGCPVRVDQQADADGDGVADFVDQCPNEVGTGFTNGCPVGVEPVDIPDQDPPQGTLVMVWDSTDECMVGVPLNAEANVNVRDEPSITSAIVDTLVPGEQYAPYYRDYDENSDVWFRIPPGWVADSAVIDNGQCVNLPQVIYVDAPDSQINARFDFDSLPMFSPDDRPTLENLFEFDPPIVVIVDGFLPVVGPLPTPNIGGPPPAVEGLFDPDGNPVEVDDQVMIVFVSGGDTPDLPPNPCIQVGGQGACMDAVLLLPAFGDAAGQCTTSEFMERLSLTGWGDPHVIGLLLPAVQKVREAAARMGDGSVMPGDGSVVPGDGSVVPGDGSVVPSVLQDFNYLMGGSAIPTDPCVFGLLLPAVQQGSEGIAMETYLMTPPELEQ